MQEEVPGESPFTYNTVDRSDRTQVAAARNEFIYPLRYIQVYKYMYNYVHKHS